ncbi:MAG: serine/threonine-protein kinase [Bryobacterales bacterium]|nr:serine/threonine-protein kinase [Bryobacterales bacterium]
MTPHLGENAIGRADLWRRAYALFDHALDLPPAERTLLVERESQGEPGLSQLVFSLLDRSAAEDGMAAIDPLARIGRHIGRYELTAILGRGGMGQVYAARDTELDRMVALKFLATEFLAGPRGAAKLIQEAKSASALNHPNIVTIYDVVRHESEIALAMELVEGVALREHCSQPQPPAFVARVGRQIAQALEATHQRGIVHRDIKPENVMIRADGGIKVLDFGLAWRTPFDDANDVEPVASASGVLGGTLNYMSPEQTHGKAATPASDIFSLGAVLYETLCGRHPFSRPSPVDTAHAIAYEPAPAPAVAVPAELAALLQAMLDKEPARRPTAHQVQRRLSEIDVSTPPKAPRPGRRSTIRRFALRAGIAAGLCVGAVVAWRLLFPQPPLRLVPLAGLDESGLTIACVSPDGKSLAYAAADSVAIRRLDDGTTLRLAAPRNLHATRIAWFADQSRLLVSGTAGEENTSSVWVLPAEPSRPPLSVFVGGRDATPSPAGDRIALTSADGGRIWVAGTSGSSPRVVRAAAPNVSYSSLTWSPDGRKLSYMVLQPARYEEARGRGLAQSFQILDIETGKLVDEVADLAPYASTALSDGRIIALEWAYPSNSHGGQLLEIRTDPVSGRFLGQSRRPMPYVWDGLYSSFSASRDGSVMSLVSTSAYLTLHLAAVKRDGSRVSLASVERLTGGAAEDYPHAWSRDSREVIFESTRGYPNYSLFRVRLDRRVPEPLFNSSFASALPHTSPDGNWILFRNHHDEKTRNLSRLPIGGGAAHTTVPDLQLSDEFRCGQIPGSRCVLRSTQADQFVYRELDPLHGVGRELVRTPASHQLFFDWDLSPDGRTVANPNHDPKSAHIQLIPLDVSAGAQERIVPIPGMRNLQAVAWDPAGTGLFVTAHTESGGVLFHCDLNGTTQKLLETRRVTFPVPSPDGNWIVFPERNQASRVERLQAP